MISRDARGSVTTEMVLLTPVLLVLLGFVVFAGRVGSIQQMVVAAVDEGARAASLTGAASRAEQVAAETVTQNLADAGVACHDLSVGVDTTSFRRGGHVSVSASCAIGLDDVVFAGLPGQRSFRAVATEVIDVYRGDDS